MNYKKVCCLFLDPLFPCKIPITGALVHLDAYQPPKQVPVNFHYVWVLFVCRCLFEKTNSDVHVCVHISVCAPKVTLSGRDVDKGISVRTSGAQISGIPSSQAEGLIFEFSLFILLTSEVM